MNGSMVNPNEGVVQNPLPVFQKGLPLKICKKQALGSSLVLEDTVGELIKNWKNGHVKFMVN